MKIGAIGYNYEHRGKYVMDRPDGTGCYLLLLIKEPSIFIINGSKQRVPKNSMILFSPDTKYSYYGEKDVYTDDWMFMEMDKEDLKNIEKHMKLDTILPVSNIEELSQVVRFIAYEHYSKEPYSEEIIKLYTGIFFFKLFRALKPDQGVGSQSLSERHDAFFHIRNMIYSEPQDIICVDELAKSVGMSRSGFQHLYKRIFGVSVMEDIISGRLKRAKSLLRTTNLMVREIALKSGYTNEFNFMRQFKSKEGMTPTEYRNTV